MNFSTTRIILASTLLAIALAAAPSVARAQPAAEECPPIPQGAVERRTEAKRFFDRAQASQAAGEDSAAMNSYLCSFRMVRHPFTAFNMAKVAEKTEELELAVSSYNAYLELAPGAHDREQVRREVGRLQERIDEINRNSNISAIESIPRGRKPRTVEKAEPESAIATPGVAASNPGRTRRIAGFVVLGSGVALIGGGLVLNLLARDKMETCDNLWETDRVAARAACDAARPRAYLSYGTFGLGAAAAVAGALLIGWDVLSGSGGDAASGRAARPRPRLGFVPVGGGGGVVTLSGLWR